MKKLPIPYNELQVGKYYTTTAYGKKYIILFESGNKELNKEPMCNYVELDLQTYLAKYSSFGANFSGSKYYFDEASYEEVCWLRYCILKNQITHFEDAIQYIETMDLKEFVEENIL